MGNVEEKKSFLKIIINKIFMLLLCNIVANITIIEVQTKNMTDIKPPILKTIPTELKKFDVVRIDNYYWLNQRKNKEVVKYLKDENAYTDKMLSSTKKLQNKLLGEIKGRMKQTDMSVPFKYNGYYYHSKFEAGKEYPIFSRHKENLLAKEEVFLDVNLLAEGKSYYNLGDYSITPDNQTIAYSFDQVSRREYTIVVKDINTNKVYNDKIEKTSGDIIWANDNTTFFYIKKDLQTLREFQVYKHTLGADPKNDKLVFEELDETFNVSISKTKSEKYILINSSSTLSSETRFIKADAPNEDFQVFQPRCKDLEYSIEHFNDEFLIVTNHQAKNFRLMKTSVLNTHIENWVELIANRDDVLIEDIEIFKNFLVIEERKNGLTQVRVINQKTKEDYYLPFNDPTFSAGTSTNLDFDTEILRYSYTSLTTPNSVYDFNMSDKTQVLLKQEEVVGGYNPQDYVSERLYVKAKDQTLIPVSLVYKKGLERTGNNPVLQYAYGSYGISMDPYFSVARLSLLDRGFVYAIAHIRGGQELGRQWYEDGKLLKKMNTFTDFIDVSKFLIEQKYTSSEKLFAMGGSAGGLLMGVVSNLAPELYKGIIAAVPFVDVVTTMLDPDIPLTTGEYDEWGNPNEKEYFDYMLSYSPIDQVKAQYYTNMLVTTGFYDSQVQYWEPAKWVAKLRDLKTDNNLLLFHTNMEAGHSGRTGRFAKLKEVAMQYAFMLDLVGLKN